MDEINEFGFLPETSTYTGTTFSVAPLPHAAEVIAGVSNLGRTLSGWFYPPIVRKTQGVSEGAAEVEIYAPSFSLKPTHRLTVAARDDDSWLAPFILHVFGFAKGIRLIPKEWIHFYRAAVEIGKLTDFHTVPNEVIQICDRAYEVWCGLPDRALERRLFGVYHWYLFGQSYEQEFERFNAQYTVLDGCYALTKKLAKNMPHVRHGRRAEALCDKYGIPVPDWARCDSKGACAVSRLRNDFVHEGLYGGEPIGFAYPKEDLADIDLELTNLNARLLLAILGISNGYVQSVVNTRQIFGLD